MITPLPIPPSRQDPTNFSERADAFMAALPTFATEANSTATSVNNDASAASASAVNAAVSATAANASANVSKWVSGTTYAQGDVEWSPINFFSYRRKIAGAGTTDPSADPTNWALVSGAGDVSLVGVQTLTNKTLTSPTINTPVINTPVINTPVINTPVINSINGGQLAGMRNKIINGKMDVSQRGVSFPAWGSGSYSLDRYLWQNTSAGVITISQQADAPADNEFQSSLRVAVTTADASVAVGDIGVLSQWIEGYNVRDLIGRTFTLSFRVRSSKTGTHCVALKNESLNRAYVFEYTVNTVNAWETKTVTVSGGLITAGTWNWTNGTGLIVAWPIVAGSNFQTTAGAWQTGDFYATANQVNCLDTIGNIFAITGVQLEVGSVATPFEHRPYGMELALCQRYFEICSFLVKTTANNSPVNFRQVKRASPTLIIAIESGTGGTIGLALDATTGFYQAQLNSSDSRATVTAAAEL